MTGLEPEQAQKFHRVQKRPGGMNGCLHWLPLAEWRHHRFTMNRDGSALHGSVSRGLQSAASVTD